MAPTRHPYGQALGFVGHFQFTNGPVLSGTAGLFTQSDTTPDVTLGGMFIANNTGATTITYFDLQSYTSKAPDYSGKQIRVWVLDNGSTQFANSGQMFLQGTNNLATFAGAIGMYEFVFLNSAWYQTGAALQNRNEVLQTTLTAASSVAVDGVKVLLLNNTGSVTRPISAFSGGQVGQTIQVSLVGSNPVRFVASATLILVGTNAFVTSASGLYQFTKVSATEWRLLTATTLGIS